MLSQHERRALAEIEQRLRANAPELAYRLEHGDPGGRRPRRRVLRGLAWAGFLLGAVALVAAFCVRSADLALLAVIAITADAAALELHAIRRHRTLR